MAKFTNRYERNQSSITRQETELLREKRACILGAGGLGGFIAEALLRVGIGSISIIDGDVFDETNLNRQIFCTEDAVGKPKAEVAKQRLLAINSEASIRAHACWMDEGNAEALLKGHDIVMDALDSIAARRIAADACRALEIPMVHGAIGGWYGQVALLRGNYSSFDALYKGVRDENVDKTLGNLPFVAMCTASIQCAEAVKLLLSKGARIENGFVHIDLLENEMNFFQTE